MSDALPEFEVDAVHVFSPALSSQVKGTGSLKTLFVTTEVATGVAACKAADSPPPPQADINGNTVRADNNFE